MSSNGDTPIDFPLASTLNGLIVVLKQADAVRYVSVASLAILLYDHVITFDVEVQRIWSLKWRLPKILFLINRYITPPMLVFNGAVLTLRNLSTSFCGFWLQWQAWPTLIALATVELILILRVAAIYDNNKYIYGLLIALYLCEVGSMLGIVGFLYQGDPNPVPSFSFLPGCYSISFVNWLYGYWVAPVILESVIIILTVFRMIQLMTDNGLRAPTMRLIARDSAVYFVFMFSVLVANLIIFKAAPPFLTSLLIGPSSAIACVAIARLMMNMRSLAFNQVMATSGAPTYELDSLQSVRFRKHGVHTATHVTGTDFND